MSRQIHENEDSCKVETPEGFASKNVKLITFLICVGLFLAVLGPFGYFAIKDSFKKTDQSKPQMTMNNIVGLSELDQSVNWKTLKGFAYEDRSTDNFVKWVFVIDSEYEVWAGGEPEADKPTYITLYNLNSGAKTEVRGADINKFLDEQVKEK